MHYCTRISISLLLAVLASAAPAAAQQQGGATLFRDARVFDGATVHARLDVLVQDGRIAQVGRNITAPAGASVIEAAGHTLLPGLIDAHTHVFQDALREALVFGVTTELDMFTEARGAAVLRQEQREGRAHDRADLFSAGTLVTAPGGHGTQFGFPIPTITHVDSARAFVTARIAEGSDWIKIVYDDGQTFGLNWNTVSHALLRELIAAAHELDRLAVVHVSTAQAAREAIEAGADGLVHLFTDQAADAGLARLARERSVFIVPTLVVLKSITGVGGSAPLLHDDRIVQYLHPASRLQLEQAFPARGDAEERYGFARDAVRTLHAAGVPILAGSDAPNPGTAHGAALHRELELLVEAGLTPVEVLAAATSGPARAFGLDDRGRIAVGLRADLLLVAGDPTTDITATRAIEGVWKAGVRADRAAWAAAVEDAVARAALSAEPPADGVIADFEGGRMAPRFGTDWMISTDAFQGGTSTAATQVVEGGAGGSGHALEVTGRIEGSQENAWAGIMWSPGAQPMQPVDLSERTGISFDARGDGRGYRVLIFAQSRGMTPLISGFDAPADWTRIEMPWADFGVDGSDIMGVVIVAGQPAGPFSVRIDNVRLY